MVAPFRAPTPLSISTNATADLGVSFVLFPDVLASGFAIYASLGSGGGYLTGSAAASWESAATLRETFELVVAKTPADVDPLITVLLGFEASGSVGINPQLAATASMTVGAALNLAVRDTSLDGPIMVLFDASGLLATGASLS